MRKRAVKGYSVPTRKQRNGSTLLRLVQKLFQLQYLQKSVNVLNCSGAAVFQRFVIQDRHDHKFKHQWKSGSVDSPQDLIWSIQWVHVVTGAGDDGTTESVVATTGSSISVPLQRQSALNRIISHSLALAQIFAVHCGRTSLYIMLPPPTPATPTAQC